MTGTTLARTNGTSVGHRISQDQIELIKRQICRPKHREATDDELALFIHQAERTGLDPFSRQIYAVYRHDNSIGEEKLVIQTGIDGFRLVAERTGQYLGQDGPWWCGIEGDWRDTWFGDELPKAARVVVRKLIGGQVAETPAVAHFAEYAATGTGDKMWREKPALMIAKCAEALALRKAFPQELSGLYTIDEMPAPVQERGTFVEDPAFVAAASLPGDTSGSIDPAHANDLFDAFRARGLTVDQFRRMVAAAGVTDLPDDLRSRDVRLGVLARLTVAQATNLEKALFPLPVSVSQAKLDQ